MVVKKNAGKKHDNVRAVVIENNGLNKIKSVNNNAHSATVFMKPWNFEEASPWT